MHWHEDFQFIYVIDGELYLHTLDQTKNCFGWTGVCFSTKMLSTSFWARPIATIRAFFSGAACIILSQLSSQKYVKGIADCKQVTCLQFDRVNSWQDRVLELLKQLSHIDPASAICYEYEVLSLLVAFGLN